jgi:hypothetical protein
VHRVQERDRTLGRGRARPEQRAERPAGGHLVQRRRFVAGKARAVEIGRPVDLRVRRGVGEHQPGPRCDRRQRPGAQPVADRPELAVVVFEVPRLVGVELVQARPAQVRVLVVAEQVVHPFRKASLKLAGLVEQRGRLVFIEVAEVLGPVRPGDRRSVDEVAAQHELGIGQCQKPRYDRPEVRQVAVKIRGGYQRAPIWQRHEAVHPATVPT